MQHSNKKTSSLHNTLINSVKEDQSKLWHSPKTSVHARPSSLTPKSTMPDILEYQASFANQILQSVESFADLKNQDAAVVSSNKDDKPLQTTQSPRVSQNIPKPVALEDQAVNDVNLRESRLARFRSNKSATTVGEEYRASRAERRKSIRLAKQVSERNVPFVFENEESLDTTEPLSTVSQAIHILNRKASHGSNMTGNGGINTSNSKLGLSPLSSHSLIRKASSQNMHGKQTGLGSNRGSIKSLRRTSYQSLPNSVASDSSQRIPEFDFHDDDDELISSGFHDSVPFKPPKTKDETSMATFTTTTTNANTTKGSQLTAEEKRERKRLIIEEEQRILTLKAQYVGKKSREEIHHNEVFSIPLLSFDHTSSFVVHRKMTTDASSIRSRASIYETNLKLMHLRQNSERSIESFRNIVAVRRSHSTMQKGKENTLAEPFLKTSTNGSLEKGEGEGKSESTYPPTNPFAKKEGEEEEKSIKSPIAIRFSINRRGSIRSNKSRMSILSHIDKQGGHRDRPVSFSLYPRKSIVPASHQPELESLEDVHFNQHRTASVTSSKKLRAELCSYDSFTKAMIEAARNSTKKSNGSLSVNQSKQEVKPSDILVSPDRPSQIEKRNENSVSSLKKSSITTSTTPAAEENGRLSIREQANAEYNEYLLLQQRHDSINFIHQMASTDLVYEQQALRIKHLGSHLIGGQIGKGAFGKVKEGICTESLQRVAVKVIAKKRAKKNVDGVVREIKLLRRLKHKNVVTLVDVFAKVEDDEGKMGVFPWFLTIEEEPIVWMFENGEEEEKNVKILKWYIVMEFCPCSLQTVLDHTPNHKISLSDAHSYFTQLMHGISYLHSQKVIRRIFLSPIDYLLDRDIKPGNLLLTTDGVIKITDFGIAEIFDIYSDEPMNCTQFAGTHQYLSPEVISDEMDTGYDGTKVDIWACGVVLYNLISGFFPFEFGEEPNILELHEKIVKGEFVMPSEAVFPLDDLIKGILTVDPVSRMTVEQILAHPWVLSQDFTLTSGILTYHHSKKDLKGHGMTLIPCETTMLPFISQLYLQELEFHMKNIGTVNSVYQSEEEGPKDNIMGTKIHSGIKWFKKHVSFKK